ncbi:unnamed protein product [Cylindrotheca closterium]|uniref:BZIP domain-containing protein n=1 Tax=Cylindrotheca closterium TaxID=2856 RepID=A0AAD2FXA8_9STRA|nr:unnamed protein product [Cylindrotheca closterium]
MTMTSQFPFVVDVNHLSAALAAAAELAKADDFAYNADASVNSSDVEAVRIEKPIVRKYRLPTRKPKSTISSDLDHSDDERKEYHEDAEQRMARSRERNREHARRTRLRKKAQLEALQSKVKGLQAESNVLKQSLEECSIATILVGLASGENNKMVDELVNEVSGDDEPDAIRLVGGKRKRFVSDTSEKIPQALTIKINGRTATIGGGRTHINWKSGVYSDEHGSQIQLSNKDLESLRRERNRMHAKMTRDRKKNFISSIEKTIEKLESRNGRMKKILQEFIQLRLEPSAGVTPMSSPGSVSIPGSVDEIPNFNLIDDGPCTPRKKRMRIGS